MKKGMEPHHGDEFYDDVIEDTDGRETGNPDELDVDGLVPELTYVEACSVSRGEVGPSQVR